MNTQHSLWDCDSFENKQTWRDSSTDVYYTCIRLWMLLLIFEPLSFEKYSTTLIQSWTESHDRDFHKLTVIWKVLILQLCDLRESQTLFSHDIGLLPLSFWHHLDFLGHNPATFAHRVYINTQSEVIPMYLMSRNSSRGSTGLLSQHWEMSMSHPLAGIQKPQVL